MAETDTLELARADLDADLHPGRPSRTLFSERLSGPSDLRIEGALEDNLPSETACRKARIPLLERANEPSPNGRPAPGRSCVAARRSRTAPGVPISTGPSPSRPRPRRPLSASRRAAVVAPVQIWRNHRFLFGVPSPAGIAALPPHECARCGSLPGSRPAGASRLAWVPSTHPYRS